MNRKQLPPHEWLVIVLLISLLGLTTVIVMFNGEDGLDLPVSAKLSSVVGHPAGAKGEPALDPDPGRSKAKSKKKKDSSVVTVYLEGAVQKKGPMRVPLGTSFEALLKLVEFAPGADLSQFENNKKKLTEGQVIRVGIKSLL